MYRVTSGSERLEYGLLKYEGYSNYNGILLQILQASLALVCRCKIAS